MHTVRGARRRGKSVAGQLAKGLCERATQVIVGVSVTTRKARAAPTQSSSATAATGVPCRSNSLAIHLSAILQSGWGNRCGIRSRCSQAW